MFNGLIGYIFGGLVIGVLARLLKPGADPLGWIMTIVLGIVGTVVGGYISDMLHITSSLMQWAVAIGAAIVLLAIYEAARKKS
jgi:uncharacterized membrane protein YeaQ/YmgE (transglycosylase-associated protein family)